MAIRKRHIREIVESLLDRHGVKAAPVPIEKIARAHEIELKAERVDDDLSGFLLRAKGSRRAIIGVNDNHHPNRQRFTIAHELGHYLLHEGEAVHLDQSRSGFTMNFRDQESATGEDDAEREANLFAAELLMPAGFLQKDVQGKDLDLLDVDDQFLGELAKRYKVSVQALTFRLANLGHIKL
jgi:Zn-dependent peptidase ImmA (M78 family)